MGDVTVSSFRGVWGMTRWTLALALIISLTLIQVASAQPQDSTISSHLSARLALAEPGEQIPVIVLLNTSLKGPGSGMLSTVKAMGGTVRHRYTIVDGFSATLPAESVRQLARLSGVRKIYLDTPVTIPPPPGNVSAALSTSVSAVGAQGAWALGYTGANVTVAVVDTGINYTHPDLGGCLGPGCKVAGGYDFVNGDPDPMDDNGHGTHVAGIIAASGGTSGVAPDSTLLAVKVLDVNGTGMSSWVIAGIDWAVANGADIVSMSLGASSQPPDEFESIVAIVADQAVRRGVVVVVAAGNDGPGTGTLSSTAAGRYTIAVGASDDAGTVAGGDDAVASFSSRGPAAFGRIAPDLAAPGVGINSTWYDGGYRSLSGTSMATPHVSGAAALLLQKNPALSPEQLRGLLVHTTYPIPGSVFERGTGALNITRAVTTPLTALVGGGDRWEVQVFPGQSASTRVLIRSNTSADIALSLSLENITDPEGFSSLPAAAFSYPANLTVPAGGEAEFELNFTAPAGAAPGTYGTVLQLSSPAHTLRIPIAITIPLAEGGLIQGTADADIGAAPGYACLIGYTTTCPGDWVYYAISSHNGSFLNVSLTWSDPGDDLDLYLFTPGGVLVNMSLSNTSGEEVTLADPAYREYWVGVHAYNLNGTASYTIRVSHPAGALKVEPSAWQGALTRGDSANITFSIVNGASPASVMLSVDTLSPAAQDSISGTIGDTGGLYHLVWQLSSAGIDANRSRYLNLSLDWNTAAADLDMGVFYYNGTQWLATRYVSMQNNTLLGDTGESLQGVDIAEVLRYPDFGIGVKNTGDTASYTLTLNFTGYAPWSAAAVSDSTLNLSPGELRQVNVTVNTSALTPGRHSAVLVIRNASDTLAEVPLLVDVLAASDTTPPEVLLSYPASVERGTSANLSIEIRDANPGSYSVYENGTLVAQGGYTSGVPFNVSINTSVLGVWNYTVVARDTAGNQNSTSALVRVGDTLPPVLVVLSPGNRTYPRGDLDYSVGANEALSWAVVSIDGGANMSLGRINSTHFTNASGAHPALQEGEHLAVFHAQDTAGRVGSASVHFTVDTTPPQIALLPPTPANGAALGSGTTVIILNITIAEQNPDTLILSWNGANQSFNYSSGYVSITKSVASGKSYTFYLWANDTAGNVNATPAVTFSVAGGSGTGGGTGGGGGAGGGISGGAKEQGNEVVIPAVRAGEGYRVYFRTPEAPEISDIEIFTTRDLFNTKLRVLTYPEKPEHLEAAPGETYRYFRIEYTGKKYLEKLRITFRVNSIWLEDNRINASSVVLYHLGEEWQPLETRKVKEALGYVYYTAEVKELSWFAVAGSKVKEVRVALPLAPQDAQVVKQAEAEAPPTREAPEMPGKEESAEAGAQEGEAPPPQEQRGVCAPLIPLLLALLAPLLGRLQKR